MLGDKYFVQTILSLKFLARKVPRRGTNNSSLHPLKLLPFETREQAPPFHTEISLPDNK